MDGRTQPDSHPARERAEELLRRVRDAVTIRPPPRVVLDPAQYALGESREILAQLRPHLERLVADHVALEGEVARLRIRNDCLQYQVRDLQEQVLGLGRPLPRELTSADRVRALPLSGVLRSFGGIPEREGPGIWRLHGERLRVSHQAFSLTRGGVPSEGVGAVDFVRHTFGLGEEDAADFLRQHLRGPQEGRHALGRMTAPLQPSFSWQPPPPDPGRWPQVRAALLHDRRLPAAAVDSLHQTGRLYADQDGQAVFLCQRDGQTLGACVYPRRFPEYGGGLGASFPLVETTTGAAGGQPPRDTLVIADHPIEALSLLELRRDQPQHGRTTALTLDGDHRISPTPIQHALRRGMHVHVATSATHHGEQVWQRLRYQFPAPQVIRRRPERETWNRDLRRREWSRDPQGGAPHSRGKEYARGR